jgi:wobble nucleotide-excising tRNase
MISEINIDCVTCYKKLSTLKTDKKVNIIYGLNGTGKSTLSNYLYDASNTKFSHCSINGLGQNEDILVYNQKFINQNFYEQDSLKGIFTLSKENKDAEEKIKNTEKEISKLNHIKTKKSELIESYKQDINKKKISSEEAIWEIKTNYAGGDRVLAYCLTGFMRSKESLFGHLCSLKKTKEKSAKSVEQLKEEVKAIQGDTAQKYNLLSIVKSGCTEIESDSLFSEIIIGNESSSVANLINHLKNSDWVKIGLKYLPENFEGTEVCPFCQNKTITKELIDDIYSYFDKTYEAKISKLKHLLGLYEAIIEQLPSKDSFYTNPFISDQQSKFENLFKQIIDSLNENKNLILEKINNPSKEIHLKNTDKIFEDFNAFIGSINTQILRHNKKIDNKGDELENIKKQFWDIMRWEYDQTISSFNTDKSSIENKIKTEQSELKKVTVKISDQYDLIQSEQKKTINIDESIENINNGLLELGIDGFAIKKHSDNFYKIARTEECLNTFHTLSEGEKMIISFLYFRELCKGKTNPTYSATKKIIVIDDPISSLSHVYIFNIGQLIKNDFFNSQNFEQIFVLTHSLYFFYELADANHKRRKENQKLFRITKNCNSSSISEMKYEEIQNDYHSYWYIVKDENQPPALIANCMRNIIEYFFNFIEKRDLNNVFQKKELQSVKYQAFCRYINRESHSLGQNIFDFKEFNYDIFKEALGLVFKESGYPEHFEQMMK